MKYPKTCKELHQRAIENAFMQQGRTNMRSIELRNVEDIPQRMQNPAEWKSYPTSTGVELVHIASDLYGTRKVYNLKDGNDLVNHILSQRDGGESHVARDWFTYDELYDTLL